MNVRDVAIIGAGPAGVATAIQLKRLGLDPLVFERNAVGGLLRNANLIENYLGFPDGISGAELVQRLEEHMEAVGAEIRYEEVHILDFERDHFTVETGTSTIWTEFAVVASGTGAHVSADLTIPEAARAMVYNEVFPLLDERDKLVLIVGAGDVAFDYALNLAKHNDVIILNRGNESGALGLLQKRVAASGRIKCKDNSRIIDINVDDAGMLDIEISQGGDLESVKTNYLLPALGRDPQLDLISDRLWKSRRRLEKQDRLHLVGDVKNGRFRQAAIAAGDGLMAAMKICERTRTL